MIHPKELRIGNWVYWKQTADLLRQGWYVAPIIQIDGNRNTVRIDDGIVISNLSIEKDIKPIELTPEILTEWCGFERREWDSYYDNILLDKREKVSGFIYDNIWCVKEYPHKTGRTIYFFGRRVLHPLSSSRVSHENMWRFEEREGFDMGMPLHRFQNLYFALTGTELEIKIPVKA